MGQISASSNAEGIVLPFTSAQFVDDFTFSLWVQALPIRHKRLVLAADQFTLAGGLHICRRAVEFDSRLNSFNYSHVNELSEFNDPDATHDLPISIAETLADGNWHHLTFAFSRVSGDPAVGTLKYYLDGILLHTISDLNSVGFSTPRFSLRHEGMYVDDVRIFDRELSADEVAHLRHGLAFLPTRTDTVAPTTPANASFQTADGEARASWDVATDETKLNGYIIHRNNRPYRFLKDATLLDRVALLHRADEDFDYTLRAFDYDLNVSPTVTLGTLNLIAPGPNSAPIANIDLRLQSLDLGVSVDQLDLDHGYRHDVKLDYNELNDDGEIVKIDLYRNNIFERSLFLHESFISLSESQIGTNAYFVDVFDAQGAVTRSNTVSMEFISSPEISFSHSDYPLTSLLLSAEIGQTPQAFIKLDWPDDTKRANYVVSRKSVNDTTWQFLGLTKNTTTEYTDTTVSVGEVYEYRVTRIYARPAAGAAFAYITASIEAPLVDAKGTVLLVVDNTVATALRTEIDRFKQDLLGDGWTRVVERSVERDVDAYTSTTDSTPDPRYSARVQAVKTLITNEFNAAPEELKAVILLGRVPIPYSGHRAWDGHDEPSRGEVHRGGWPADLYYGDVLQLEGDGEWVDVIDPTYTPSDFARNRNLPGDGKFDNNAAPSKIELPIGRIDLAGMSKFSSSEVELLRNYLNKNHKFRHGLITAREKGIIDIDTSFRSALFLRDDYAAPAFNNLAAMFGHANVDASNKKSGIDFFGSTVASIGGDSYLFGYGTGPGNVTRAIELFDGRTAATPARCRSNSTTTNRAYTCDFADYDPQIMFSVLFGSYFGDWSLNNSLLRAPLAADNYGLSCLWGVNGDPSFIDAWFFHRMGLGDSLGECLLLSQNNRDTYIAYKASDGDVPLSLMGDPTLRVFVCKPPSTFAGSSSGSSVTLTWLASPSANIVGYHIYRENNNGTFERLTTAPINALTYTDTGLSSGTYKYMLRAVELKTSGSGSFHNASQGIFVDITVNE